MEISDLFLVGSELVPTECSCEVLWRDTEELLKGTGEVILVIDSNFICHFLDQMISCHEQFSCIVHLIVQKKARSGCDLRQDILNLRIPFA